MSPEDFIILTLKIPCAFQGKNFKQRVQHMASGRKVSLCVVVVVGGGGGDDDKDGGGVGGRVGGGESDDDGGNGACGDLSSK